MSWFFEEIPMDIRAISYISFVFLEPLSKWNTQENTQNLRECPPVLFQKHDIIVLSSDDTNFF